MKKMLFPLLLLMSFHLSAQLKLPAFFSDNMVMQRDAYNHVWGWAQPDAMVSVTVGNKSYQTYADKEGDWELFLDPIKAGKVGVMQIQSGKELLEIKNILSGEVWICSGQSNMEWTMSLCDQTYGEEISKAGNDSIRFMVAERAVAVQPQHDMKIKSKWTAIDSITIKDCSAVAYWYAKSLQHKLNVPVGLIVTSWGGTQAQSWTSVSGLHDFTNYTSLFHDKIRQVDLGAIQEKKNLLKEKYEKEVQEKYTNGKEYLKIDFNDSDWEAVHLPGQWEEAGHPNLDGLAYYRLEFNVPQTMVGKDAVLHLPAIDDKDSTYINGVLVGTNTQWDALRTYKIPSKVLRAGKNILVMKIEDFGGGGGLANLESHFNITSNQQTIALAGKAKCKVEAVMEDLTGGNGAIEQQPSVIYNAMIAPLHPLTVKGVIWYQGESNTDRPAEYRKLFPALINDWRNHWHQTQLPFLFVQLSSFGPLQTAPSESDWAALREAQTMTSSLPKTGMAVTIDVGDPDNIHPQKKKEVGERLAAKAMNVCYGDTNIVSGGPQMKGYAIKGSTIEIEFTNTGKGLMVKGVDLRHIAVAGEDRRFVWAEARIVGDKIIVSSGKVRRPVAVRYAWADSPVEANLYNIEGYPAVPFRTDEWGVKKK